MLTLYGVQYMGAVNRGRGEVEDRPEVASAGRRRRPLSRERIVQVALRLMDEEGLEAVTMRRVGRELGVEAMSLYNHVTDKDDILVGVIEAVMAQYDFPDEGGDWREAVRRMARSWRSLLKAHPNVVTLMPDRREPIASVRALRPAEHALAVLRGVGLSEREAAWTFRVLTGYVQGFVLAEIAGVFGGGDADHSTTRTAPADALPNLSAHLPYLTREAADGAFEYGLDLLLLGLSEKVASERLAQTELGPDASEHVERRP